MNYLLDTHAFFWWIQDDPALPAATKAKLCRTLGTVYVSVASLWELAIKIQIGRMRLPEPLDTYALRQIQINRMEVLTIHAPHVFETSNLPPHHKDPFDRILIAQARAEQLTLVSNDEKIRMYKVPLEWQA